MKCMWFGPMRPRAYAFRARGFGHGLALAAADGLVFASMALPLTHTAALVHTLALAAAIRTATLLTSGFAAFE